MTKLWSVDDIAEFASYSRKTAWKIVSQPGFPEPKQARPKRWDCDGVVAWILSKREVSPKPPERTALYRHFDASGRLLYVGIAKDHLKRLYSHITYSGWREEIATITVEWLDSREAALDAEASAIASERPAYNRAGVVQ